MHAIRSSSTAVSIGRKPGIGPRLSLLLSPNRERRVGSLKLLVSLIQALHTPILSLSVAKPIWNHCSLQRLHVSMHLECNILLNFLIYSQLTAEIGCNVTEAGACCKEGGIDAEIGIGASSGKDTFGPSWMPLPISSVVYNKGVGKWASPCQSKMRCFCYIALIVFRH